ncbi:MAG: phosphoglycerate kinase [Patescibacteria group bacterium]|nr:phosphoglycerate kinase [Patescibacteria group bacterium]MDE1965913.1 phosphoglycerate kinase [Patescibacteria group bacterium]
MRSVTQIPVLENIPVLVRSPFNVPIANGAVANAFRLKEALPTIDYLTKHHARVILCSHIGRADTETLKPVYDALARYVPGLAFCPEAVGPAARKAARELSPGGVLLLENLRRYPGEKKNDPKFAAELAELADVFVQDTFDVLHREHAGVVGVPKLLPSYAGFLVEREVAELSKALTPASPSLAIISGAKFETKEPVLNKLITLYDTVFVGGAIANDFLKAKGYPVGKSLVSGTDAGHLKPLLENKRLTLAVDSLVAPAGGTRADARVAEIGDVKDGEAILDVGPKTSAMLADLVKRSKTVLWNGPLGNYENGFVDGTDALAEAIAGSGARSTIGGGDTVASIEKLGINDRFSFISTGGGAMLDFLAQGGVLPGLRALD